MTEFVLVAGLIDATRPTPAGSVQVQHDLLRRPYAIARLLQMVFMEAVERRRVELSGRISRCASIIRG